MSNIKYIQIQSVIQFQISIKLFSFETPQKGKSSLQFNSSIACRCLHFYVFVWFTQFLHPNVWFFGIQCKATLKFRSSTNNFIDLWIVLLLQRLPYDGGVQNMLKEDQIPFRFLFTLLVQFVCLIIDRALYLRRNMKGKIIFYLVSVVAVHIWQLHFMLWYHEKPYHLITWPPMLFYFVKCIYFLLSAYQIRCGYPKRVSGNFANNGFSLMNWRVFELYEWFRRWLHQMKLFSTVCFFFFRLNCSYQMIPFLSEARTLLDWICIKTSLTLYEWFKMEDIYSDMFVIKVRKR